MTTKFRSALYLLIAALVLMTTAQVMAGASSAKPANEHEFIGTVTAMTATTVTISSMTFDIAQAEVNDTIALGDVVKVHYTVATNGTFVAREVELALEVTPEATAEATDIFDDHGQDDPATHDVNDDHRQDDPATHDVGDDHGGQNNDNTVDDNNNSSGTTDNRGQGSGSSSQDDGGHHGENSGSGSGNSGRGGRGG